jgi:hypothetical protein
VHSYKTLPKRAKTFPKTEKSAAVGSRKKEVTKKRGQEQQNRPKTEGRNRHF